MSVGAVRDLEQGRTRRPRDNRVHRLADALRVDEAQRWELLSWGVPVAGGAGQRPDAGERVLNRPWAGSGGAQLRLAVLGPIAAWCDGIQVKLGPGRQRAVLGLLAVNHGVMVHRDSIIDALWADHPPASAVSMMQSYVSRLRRCLHGGGTRRSVSEPGCGIEMIGAGYRLRAGDELDLYRYGQATRLARSAQAAGDAAAACALYERALALWRGDPLADVDLLRGHPAVVALGQERADLVVDYADTASVLGDPGRVLPSLRELAARDPLDERVHARLMICLAGTGRQAAALTAYGRLIRRLDRELGVRPCAELALAHRRVLRQDFPAPATRDLASVGTVKAGRR